MELENFIEMVEDFPTLPTIYTSLLETMSNPRSTVNDVAKLIEFDISASIKVLKTVNSSVYGMQTKISSIADAIFHIGFNEVKNLVLSLSMINLFSDMKTFPGFNIVELWKHSIAVGVISRKIAKLMGIKKVDDYFLSGMIHDIGKLFFYKLRPDDYALVIKKVQDNDLSVREAEIEVFGTDHCFVGAKLAEKWNLPESIVHVIRYHDSFPQNANFNVQTACIHVSNIVARTMNLGYPGDNLILRPDSEIVSKLNLSPKCFTEIHQDVAEDFSQSTTVLLGK